MGHVKSHYMLEQPQKIEVLTSGKSSIQGVNQQVTEADLGWLGGIIDGEGSIGINGRKDNSGKYFKNLIPVMQLSNTSPDMIEKVAKIFDALGIKYYMQRRYLSYNNPKHQDIYKIILGRQSQMKIFLETILPYLVVKKAQAEITLRYVKSRLNKGAKQGDGRYCPYTEEEKEMANAVYNLNCESNHRFRRREPQRLYVGQPEGLKI